MNAPEPVSTIPWKPIQPLAETDELANGSLGALDALREEWKRRLASLDESERAARRQRTLRRLAVETGILERLYDLEWGLTLTLVAEGFTRDVIERAGGVVDERTLATLRAQMDTLNMVVDFVRASRPLTPSFIKELHQAITRTQNTYTATDTLGRVVESDLPRGEWKRVANHVLRQDGALLEYTPPEHVAAEIDRLVELWRAIETARVHPIVQAAWLHHRFVQIHPFADGNGRVARALTLLVMEKHHYAPLVVDRWHRTDYLKALDVANEGDLRPLIRLFVKLESSSLANELERREEAPSGGFALDVAHTLAAQIAEVRRRRESEIQKRLEARSIVVAGHLGAWFDGKRQELKKTFAERGVRDVKVNADCEMPPSRKATWFHRQIIESARTAGHFAEFRGYAGWCSLRVRVEGALLRYVASIHGAGRDAGVMAVTTFAEIESSDEDPDGEAGRVCEYIRTTKDAFRFVHSEDVAQIGSRTGELEELLDEGLAEALVHLLRRV